MKRLPLFAREVLAHFKPRKGSRYLDASFGIGGHSSLILNSNPDCSVYAVDCDKGSHQLASDLSKHYSPNRLIPIRCKWSQLDSNLDPEIRFDGIIIDTGCSFLQLSDRNRGFVKGKLDMRFDGNGITAKNVLQLTEERPLFKLLRNYGAMSHAKSLCNSVFEGRYMYKSFDTVADFEEIVRNAAGKIAESTDEDPKKIAKLLLQQSLIALRTFVNDELNELEFLLREIAEKRLKDGFPLLLIVRSVPEAKIAYSAFEAAPVLEGGGFGNVRIDIKTVEKKRSRHPWMTISAPKTLPEKDMMLNPYHDASAVLYAVKRINKSGISL